MSDGETTARVTLDEALREELDEWSGRGLERILAPLGHRRGAEVIVDGSPAIDFSSNDYLGLASDPRVVAVARAALDSHGVGATASRLIAGDHPEHHALEDDLARFFGAEAALLFGSGYAGNLGVIPALVGREDLVLSDERNHASLIDGARLSRATVHVYSHADPDAVRAILRRHRAGARRVLIVTDGVFSMDGDLAPLPALVALAREYDAWTLVDDAHAAGVVGDAGRGTAELLGVSGTIDVTMGTLGKAFGAAGAFVHGSATLVRHLLNRARSFVFSTAMLPAQAAAAREAVRIAATDASLRTRLRHNALTLRGVLDERGFALSGRADSHIVPIVIGDSRATVAAGAALRGRGLLVGAVRPPTVPEGTARLRISVSAAHTREHIDRLTAALDDLGTRSGLDHLVRSPASEVRPPRSTRRPDASVGGEATAVAG